ncbi:AraC family transcriptional regulator [Alteromonas sp. 38]|uniref:helix-turn-helix domain-containing protein n=1 Tax=Alteromonas TaxID=226 RepID=UPI0012F182C7|nr:MULTISPECIES: helix-turn-helix domain-containing protein [Alteromonas]CAD5279834.1 AraC family transcriptional regulator [Alteromonas sp. 154]VXB77982.1 AraC family transcriptional regulator [Alteromonas sp. 38]
MIANSTPALTIVPVTKSDKVIPAYHLVNAVLDVAIPRGASKDKILRGTGIFDDSLTVNTRISAKQCIALLSNVRGQCKGNDVSFLIGKSLGGVWLRADLADIKHSQNLEQAIETLIAIRWGSIPLVSFKRFTLQDKYIWVLQDTMGCEKKGNQKLWPFIAQLYLSMLVALLKQWTGTRLPLRFTMDSDRPRNVQDFETYLGLRVTFNAPLMSITLPKSCMVSPFPFAIEKSTCVESGYDENANHKCEGGKSAEYQQPQTQSPSHLSLLDYIRSLTLQEPQKGLADLAESLGYSTATLKRKLSDHHYTYRGLSEEARRQQAIVLLALKKLNNEQSASQMAFSDLPNFRRAVKRLTGLTPSELRAR